MANELKIVIEGDATSAVGAATDTKEALGGLASATDATAESAQGLNRHTREMRLLFSQLNQITPGLGTGFRGLAMGMGEFAVMILAVQAIVTWWKYLHETQKAAAEQQARNMELWHDATKTAIDEQFRFVQAIKDLDDPLKKNKELMDQSIATIEERIKVQEKWLAGEQEAALQNAKTEEEKEVLRKRYAALKKSDEDRAAQEKINSEQSALNSALALEAEHESKIDDLMTTRKAASDAKDTARYNVLTAQIAELDQKIEKDKAEIESMTAKLDASKQGLVEGMNPMITEAVLHGGKALVELQRQFLNLPGGGKALGSIWNEGSLSPDARIMALNNALAQLQDQPGPFAAGAFPPPLGVSPFMQQHRQPSGMDLYPHPPGIPPETYFGKTTRTLPRDFMSENDPSKTSALDMELRLEEWNKAARARDEAILKGLQKGIDQHNATTARVNALATSQ